MKMEEEIYFLYKHKNYSNAKFITSCLMLKSTKYQIIMQILEYESGNYSRSLFFVTNSYTSLFYEALAYRNLKEFGKAAASLNKIIENKFTKETKFDSKMKEIILEHKIENIYELLGDIYKEMGESRKAKKMYKKAIEENFLLKKSFLSSLQKKNDFVSYEDKPNLPNFSNKFSGTDFHNAVQNELDKKIEIPYVNLELKENNSFNFYNNEFKGIEDKNLGSETNFYESESINFSNLQSNSFFEEKEEENCGNNSVINIIKKFYVDIQDVKGNFSKYKNILPGFGSYFLKEYATVLSENGEIEEAIEIFEIILQVEKIYTSRMDIYSSLLYKRKEKEKLANFARKLLKSNFNHPVTWAVLGNYYSLISNHKKSLACLEKSLSLKMNFNTLNLIGHEFVQKNEYETAKSYFNMSLLMEPENFNAFVGLGICYFNTQQSEAGIYYLKKAVSVVPSNLFIRYILIKNALKEELYEECVIALEDTFQIKTNKSKETKLENLLKHLFSCGRPFNEYESMILVKMSELFFRMNLLKEAKDVLLLVNDETPGYKKLKLDISVEENRNKK